MAIFQKKHISSILSPNLEQKRGLFLKRVGSLLEEGYSVKEGLIFLNQFEKDVTLDWIVAIQEGMIHGHSLHEELEKLKFPKKICAQIYLSTYIGNYNQTIRQCGEQLLISVEKKKKFQSLLSYPILLLFFLLFMVLLMKFLILPHIEILFSSLGSQSNLYSNSIVLFIYYSPQIILSLFVVVILVGGIIKRKLNQISAIDQINFYMKNPMIASYIKYYWTSFFFSEWGNLLKNGCSIHEVINIMQSEEASKLLKETGDLLSEQMKQGQTVNESLKVLSFLKEDAFVIVEHGENLGKLGTEMLVYASYCENELNNQVESLMERIQPVIFIFIGLMIVAIYSALMLPMFTLLEGF